MFFVINMVSYMAFDRTKQIGRNPPYAIDDKKVTSKLMGPSGHTHDRNELVLPSRRPVMCTMADKNQLHDERPFPSGSDVKVIDA